MKRLVPVLLASSAALFAQSSTSRNSTHSLASPTLGFISAANGTQLSPIFGIPGAARLGPALSAGGATALYVAPRGAYLLASNPGAGVSIAPLRPAAALQNGLMLNPLAGIIGEPDLVSFSPSGSTAALYSKQSNTVQVLTGLPGSPHLGHNFPVAATLLQLAVSDDGGSLLIQEEGGAVSPLGGQPLYQAQSTATIVFLPGGHDAVLADPAANVLLRLPASGGTIALDSSLPAPPSLAVTADGSALLAASQKSVWVLNLGSGKSQQYPVAGVVKSLRALAIGDTFLITYQDGSYGLLAWHNSRLSTFSVGAARNSEGN
jgi:hypothetical protein